jgi:hypothetical protein
LDRDYYQCADRKQPATKGLGLTCQLSRKDRENFPIRETGAEQSAIGRRNAF